ncbi:MAG: metal ABC transporter permease, partial [Candidatus Saccharimonadales bacterium]
VPVKLLGIVFLYVLALTVTAAAQIVGTLLVLSLAITPAAAAQRLASRPFHITLISVAFALIASLGGILASLASGTVKPSVFVTGISFALYVFARVYGKRSPQRKTIDS